MPTNKPGFEFIHSRKWEEIRNYWLNHIPYIDPAGSAPGAGIDDIPGFEEISLRVLDRGHVGWEVIELPGVREASLHHAIFMLHKAMHVLGAAELCVVHGMPTWSLSNAYQSAIFAARSMLGFLGVGWVEVSSKAVVIDVWARRPEKGKISRTLDPVMILSRAGVARLDQRDMWNLLQRVLRVSQIRVGWEKVLTGLKNLDERGFAQMRNALHYRSEYWVHEDLHVPMCCVDLGAIAMRARWRDIFDLSRRDFTIVLALSLVRVALAMIEDMGRVTNRLADEWRLLKEGVDGARHPIFYLEEAPAEEEHGARECGFSYRSV